LAVLSEPAGSHWHATYDGTSLTRVTAYGWAQGFEIPAGAGQLKIWSSSGARHTWIWLELLALVAVIGVGVAAAPRRPARDVL
jgi:streptogramin lyase